MKKELVNLGSLYVSDFISEGDNPRCDRIEMKMVWDENMGAPRLETITPPEYMYGKYWYRSGTNDTMKKELKNVVDSITDVYKINDGDTWLDIACNDGTLLSYVSNKIRRVGVDPVDDSYVNESKKHADLIIQDYFNSDAAQKVNNANVITTIAMFYDLDNPDSFLQDINSVLDDNGLFVVQMSYTPLMIEQMAFDNICHEHIFYYSLKSIKDLFARNGLKIVDCTLNDVNGGSFRVFAMKSNADVSVFGTQPFRDVANFRINSLLDYEESQGYNNPEIWNKFSQDLESLKTELTEFIQGEVSKGKSVWGYGASTKGNTLLQYFNLDNTLISGIAERSPYKFGLKTVGTNIPIYSEEEMRSANPDYLLVLPWHFINEFIIREEGFLKSGGQFIVPCPKFEIIGSI
jgi:2-polyprenyl-3-methyl-5-hydroxy-6-metoxy-1,4-benzoquinol methylase